MGYLDSFSRSGLRASVQPSGKLRLEPDEIITEGIREIARANTEAIIAEIRETASDADARSSEITPGYRFLWVATTLESFEESDPRYGYEIGRDPVFRMLDAAYYAWLRHHMEGATKVHSSGRLSDDEYAVLRDRFNVIHTWAMAHIGEATLRRTMRTMNVRQYVPPSDTTVEAYHRSWDEARTANAARRDKGTGQHNELSPEVRRLGELLGTQGYALIRTSVSDEPVVILRDDRAVLPVEHRSKVTFTEAECAHLRGAAPNMVKQVIDLKSVIPGQVVEGGGGNASGNRDETMQPVRFPVQPVGPRTGPLSDVAVAQVDAIRDRAMTLGWTERGQYNT